MITFVIACFISLWQCDLTLHLLSAVGFQGPVPMYVSSKKLDRTETRASIFTEQEAYWTLPLEESNVICDVAVSKGKAEEPMMMMIDIFMCLLIFVGIYSSGIQA